ncbi:MAG: GWxTD domain-containing protein [Bacteroidota bacterium]
MYRNWLFVWIFLLIAPSTQAQWTFGVKRHIGQGVNTCIYLDYQSASDRAKRFLAEFNFRRADTYQSVLRKELSLQTIESKLFLDEVRLPHGDYLVDVDILDREIGTHVYLELEDVYTVEKIPENGTQTSDIFLALTADQTQAFRNPILSRSLELDQNKIYYFIEVLAPGYDALNFQAELYAERKDLSAVSAPRFVSIKQARKTGRLRRGKTFVFVDSVDVSGFAAGEYLIDIRIEQEGVRLAVQKLRFTLGGDIRKRIYRDIDNSLRQLVYVVPETQLDTLLGMPEDEWLKREAFDEVWRNMYPNEQEADQRMKAYFQKVFDANQRFVEDRPGWETDRGRIFIQYGEPKEKSLKINGEDYKRWLYPRWSLSFLFQARNQAWVLVE